MFDLCLRKTVLDNSEKFHVHVVNAVFNKFYKNNYLHFCYNLDEAITTIHDITRLLKLGGFNLAEFISNNRIILKNLSRERFLLKVVNLELEELPTNRALGITWDSNTDA